MSLNIRSTLLRDLPADRRYLIAVSGGRDSIALLHWLIKADYRNLIVCHLDHQLRGRSSRSDARFVEALAKKYQLRFELGSRNVREIAAKKKLSIETAARNARYSFFGEVAKRRRCSTIFLGHHADDLVETFLINLFRGAGAGGLSAMRETSSRSINDIDLVLVRPLLGVWRAEIDRYVQANRLKFREDVSNQNLGPLRNRIRRRVLPYLEKNVGRDVRRNIWRTATIFSEEESFFETLLPEKMSDLTAIAVEPLRKLGVALQRRTLLRWLRAANVTDVGFDLVERIRALIDAGAAVAKTNLPHNRHVRRRAGRLFME